MAYSPRRPSAAEPQPKKKNGHHHEAHEEHEGRKLFFEIRCPVRNPVFVSFANFVVRKSFVGWRIRNSRPPKTFAQAAKTFKHSSTKWAYAITAGSGAVGWMLVGHVSGRREAT
jgi:hypothetical protein